MTNEDRCPSTYSPGRAVVMTEPFASALAALRGHADRLDEDSSPRTIEALLVQMEQVIARLRVAGDDVRRWENAAEGARHALNAGDVALSVEVLREAVGRSDPK